ncbi:MAG TPA: hypothetical protein PLV68_12440, partial [Ilumatobacteraceae bacterium]|nr:hypothetical protein [Ilumatobacteraceae bacterium]
PPEKIPDQLTATSTTAATTTTTTMPTTTSSTPDSIAQTTTTTIAETTTTAQITELVEMYYVVNRQIRLTYVPFERNPPPSQVLLALQQPPST